MNDRPFGFSDHGETGQIWLPMSLIEVIELVGNDRLEQAFSSFHGICKRTQSLRDVLISLAILKQKFKRFQNRELEGKEKASKLEKSRIQISTDLVKLVKKAIDITDPLST